MLILTQSIHRRTHTYGTYVHNNNTLVIHLQRVTLRILLIWQLPLILPVCRGWLKLRVMNEKGSFFTFNSRTAASKGVSPGSIFPPNPLYLSIRVKRRDR